MSGKRVETTQCWQTNREEVSPFSPISVEVGKVGIENR